MFTRRFSRPFFSILPIRSAPISPVRATWVPPQGCRSTCPAPRPIRTSRTRPAPRGGCTDIVLTSPGLASSSASVIQSVLTSRSRATSALSASSSAALSSGGSSMAKSRRPFSAPTAPPVTAKGSTTDNRCSAVCIRIWAWRRSQSSTCITADPTGGNTAPSGGTSTISSSPSPFTVVATAISPPSQRNAPRSPGWPPPVG